MSEKIGYPREVTITVYGPCGHAAPKMCKFCGKDVPKCTKCGKESRYVKSRPIGPFGRMFYGCKHCAEIETDNYYNSPG